jgi:hypothetical protein
MYVSGLLREFDVEVLDSVRDGRDIDGCEKSSFLENLEC